MWFGPKLYTGRSAGPLEVFTGLNCNTSTMPCWLHFDRLSYRWTFPHKATDHQQTYVHIYMQLQFKDFLYCYIFCPSFVLSVILMEPPAFSHSVWPCRRKNASCCDNKGYLKCDTVFQRMGGGGKKGRERGIWRGGREKREGTRWWWWWWWGGCP